MTTEADLPELELPETADPELEALGLMLIEAAKLPRDTSGMCISASGTLSMAARSLSEMAVAPELHDPDPLATHEERLQESQPAMRAFMLTEMERHLQLLRQAVKTQDVATVRKFFDIYLLD